MSEEIKYEISLQNENGVTIFSMNEIKPFVYTGENIEDDIKHKIVAMISPMLSNMPNITKTVQGIQSYEAVFSPKMKELLKKGIATIHKDKQGELLPQIIHAGKAGKKGQIIKKVRLKSGATYTSFALLGWQVASMITAQKHLADINNKLNVISKDVKDIKQFLEDELFAQIESRVLATKNLVSCIIKNPDFFQEFKDFHASHMGANMEKTDELIRRINSMLNGKLKTFSEEKFKENNLEKTVQKYQNKIQETMYLINTSLNLIQTQHILCMIYSFYSANNAYADTWRESLSQHQENLKNIIDEFERLAQQKSENLDYSVSWWEIGIAIVAMPAALPILITNDVLSKYDANFFDPETDTEKTRKNQSHAVTKTFANLNQIVNGLFENMAQQASSINSEQKVAINVKNGEIETIKLLT